jgi:preprotein translocase subunit SecG
MQSVLIVIHLIIVLALVIVVLLQRSEGGALGVGGGGGFMTGRGQANVLTRATSILAALFFATSLGLTFLAGMNRPQEVIFEAKPEAAQDEATSQPAQGNLLDQLLQMEQTAPAPAPVQPETPKPAEAPASQ